MSYVDLEEIDRAVREAKELRRSGGYTVINRNQPQHWPSKKFGVAYLSARDIEFEERTGEDSIGRKNLEKAGYEVHPYWEQLL